MDKYLYFRGILDEDNDDGQAGSAAQLTSLCVPARMITGIGPSTDSTLQIFFKSIRNQPGHAGGANEEIVSDSITLDVTTHRHKVVADEILRAISSTGPMYTDGFIDVVDDVTTIVADDAARTATSIHGDLTNVGGYTSDTNSTGIRVAVALS
mgnify:FL=1